MADNFVDGAKTGLRVIRKTTTWNALTCRVTWGNYDSSWETGMHYDQLWLGGQQRLFHQWSHLGVSSRLQYPTLLDQA